MKYLSLLLFVLFPSYLLSWGLPDESLYLGYYDVKAASLAGSDAAVKEGADSIYANPAGLGFVPYAELLTYYSNVLPNINFLTLSLNYPIKSGIGLGVGAFMVSVSGIKKTNVLYEYLGTFEDTTSMVVLSYGQKIKKYFSVGSRFKIISHSIDYYINRSIVLDFGLYGEVPREGSIGMYLQNLVVYKNKFINVVETQPIVLKIGVSKIFPKLHTTCFLGLDTIFTTPLMVLLSSGCELQFLDILLLRMGMNYKEFACGVGVKFRKINIEYGFTFHPIGIFHRIGLLYRFDFRKDEEWERIKEEKKRLEELAKYEKENILKERKLLEMEHERLNKERNVVSKLIDMKNYIEKKEYDAAIKVAEEILSIDAENAAAKSVIATYSEKRRKEMASLACIKAEDLYKKGKYKEALKRAEEALSLYPGDENALTIKYLSLAMIYVKEKRYSEAKAKLMEALRLNPKREDIIELLEKIETLMEIR
jgi:hypothetical protein